MGVSRKALSSQWSRRVPLRAALRSLVHWDSASLRPPLAAFGSSPPRFSRSCPHCLRRFVHARTVAGQKYLPKPFHRRAGCYPTLIAEETRSLLYGRSWHDRYRGFTYGGMGMLFDDLTIQFSRFMRGLLPNESDFSMLCGSWKNPLTL